MPRLDLPDADIEYRPGFVDAATAARWFAALRDETPWRDDEITIFGRTSPVPRLQAWYGDPGCTYTYSRITLDPLPWTAALRDIQGAVERAAAASFNCVLVTLYRDGRDSNGWHSDDEPELGPEPTIASVSLGATRRFRLRYKIDRTIRHDLDLEAASLLLMRGPTQHHWSHQVPKTTAPVGPRINLTFRTIRH